MSTKHVSLSDFSKLVDILDFESTGLTLVNSLILHFLQNDCTHKRHFWYVFAARQEILGR